MVMIAKLIMILNTTAQDSGQQKPRSVPDPGGSIPNFCGRAKYGGS